MLRLTLLACLLALAAIAAPAAPVMRDFIGINGHTIQFKPDLYAPVCSLVRDYHPVEWDLGRKTSELPEWPFAKNRVDWSRVYGGWKEKGFRTDVSLMFESIKRTNWTDIEKDARAYGRAFAREFGPTGQRKLIESAEIGNEPGEWSDEDYTRLYRAMAEGLREGDPALKVVTCNLTTGKSGKYEKSVDCIKALTNLVDILNVHSYAQLENWPTWRRSFPEDPRLENYLQDIDALCRWRDTHAAGKPVWVTEFGYDSSTKTAEKTGTFAKWVGVTDEQQAQWLVRSLLVFSAMPVERAYIYFFNDSDVPSLHASAGLTRHFKPKPSFHAVAHLQSALGEYRYAGTVTNAAGLLRVQAYEHGSRPNEIAWVAWSPTGEAKKTKHSLAGVPGKLTRSELMPLSAVSTRPPGVQQQGSTVDVEVSESPVYLFFQRD